jgi:hypothetical protein
MDASEMLAEVKAYVLEERRRLGIDRVDTSTKPELSGEAFGEFEMLLDRQLVTTAVGHGGWDELRDPEILSAVYQVVIQRRSAAPRNVGA